MLSVVPYYNKPMQSGISAHLQAIAGATALPIILHDIPARTIRELADDTLTRLVESKQFIGLRDGTGDIARPMRLRSLLPQGSGCCPGKMNRAGFHRQWRGWLHLHNIECRAGTVPGDLFELPAGTAADREICTSTCAVDSGAFKGESPAALKYALYLLGLMSPATRLPIVELADSAKAEARPRSPRSATRIGLPDPKLARPRPRREPAAAL